MPNKLLLLLILIVSLVSCSKETLSPDPDLVPEESLIDISAIRIQQIAPVDIRYDNGNIVQIGNEEFFYDKEGALIRSVIRITGLPYKRTIIGSGSIDEYVLRDDILYAYSYQWGEENVKRIHLDSMIVKHYVGDKASVVQRIVNKPYGEFSYRNGRLDSFHYIDYKGVDPLTQSTVIRYDEQGNMAHITHHSVESSQWDINPVSHTVQTFYNNYDRKINPYYILYKQLGVLSPSMLEWNISLNNPLEGTIKRETRLESSEHLSYSYLYNNRDLPTQIYKKHDRYPYTASTTIRYYQ